MSDKEATQSKACVCAAWRDRQRVNLGYDTADLLDTQFTRECERNPWLVLVQCRGCGQPWYAAVDTVDDDLYVLRLSVAAVAAIRERGEWPPDFDGFVNVWPAEPGQAHFARLSWPWKDADVSDS